MEGTNEAKQMPTGGLTPSFAKVTEGKPTGQSAPSYAGATEGKPAASTAEETKNEPQNQALSCAGASEGKPGTFTAAEVETAVADALKKAGLSAEIFEKQKAEWEAKLTEAKATIFNADIVNIAGKHNVDAKALKEKAEELNITEMVKVEGLAAVMPKTGVKTDSGKTIGGDDFWKLSPEEKYRQGLEEERGKRR